MLLVEATSNEGDGHCYDVDCDLELNELADGVVNVPAPQHCLHDGVEVVVQQDDGCCLAGHLGTGDSHCEPYISFFQGRGVIGTVACHCHHLSSLLQASHQGVFVLRTGTSQHTEFVLDEVESSSILDGIYSKFLIFGFSLL